MIVVAFTTTTSVHEAVPTFTATTPPRSVKPVPVTVIGVPADSGPATGATPDTVGTAAYVKPPACVAVPPAVVTTTSFGPAVPAGVRAVMPVAVAETPVHSTPPTRTVAPERPDPEIVSVVPPVTGPKAGPIAEIAGDATYV